ncbi:protein kinase domain-containing protein [Actinomadura sp. HBU206391]|uniref:protein kinase domain-containing protein n=1 Tax=Actinomadura sp. HBU206391 TaxID=2731692 RepID=UPI00164FC582|nr:protein kinase [Actinomadura sp. HBU206391]MBC6457245.1 protein kinase [Actinomadura sp. HBU206391]
MTQRRALAIGVTEFGDAAENGSDLLPLPFAARLARELASSLGALGYECTIRDDVPFSTRALGDAVLSRLREADADSVVIVHVISHGDIEQRTGALWVAGSDGEPGDGATEIEGWLRAVERGPDGPMVLFLLDLCRSGTAARLPWHIALADGRARAWVLAACQSDEGAFDGRFSQAVINVLDRIRREELDIDPALPNVPYPAVARAVREEVNLLAAKADGSRQEVTATLIDSSADLTKLAFFPNPAHDPSDSRRRFRARLDAGLLPFLDDLDEGLDARHFIERATGSSPFNRTPGFSRMSGCFTGRRKELRRLSWLLSGEFPEVGPAPALGVVTGSPGAGKSALLGVLVCSSHPSLRETTHQVWDHVRRALYTVDERFAAVHARGRRLDEIVASIARQLGLGELDFPDDLVDAIRDLPPPAIVLDALDEAENGPLIMEELVLPLARAQRDDGSPLVRLVVGVRKYGDYAPLRDFAAGHGLLADLDDQPREVLEDDLEEYVTELLSASDVYKQRETVRRNFAREVAGVLAAPPAEGVRNRWGEFLVAGLYARHVVATTFDRPIRKAREARDLGRRVPRSLPEVLALDLDATTSSLLRPALLALARTYGDGMPLSVLRRVCGAYLTGISEPTTGQLRNALDLGRFYLRQVTDTDGTTLYRLFHQGLADHLLGRGRNSSMRIQEAFRTSVFLDLLVAPLGAGPARDWDVAEPYVIRHVLQHAADAGRLDEFAPGRPWTPSDTTGGMRVEEPMSGGSMRYGPPGLRQRQREMSAERDERPRDPDRDQTDPRFQIPPSPPSPPAGFGVAEPRVSDPDRDQTDPRFEIPPSPYVPEPRAGDPEALSPAPLGVDRWRGEASILGRPGYLEEIYAREVWQAASDLVLNGRWRLVALRQNIDRAGTSTLWDAVQVAGETPVVVKLVPTGSLGSATRTGVLRRRALRNDMRMNTRSRRIREIVDSGEDQGFGYLVMPQYGPGSLSGHLASPEAGRRLGWCLEIADQVLEGLEAAHADGFVHLDVKPANVVLDGDAARIIDWGLSVRWRNTDPGREPMTGGTPFFASPEQIAQKPGWCTPLADLYGAGALLYWLITAEAPLARELGRSASPFGVVSFLDLGGRPERVDRLVPGVPEVVADLVDRWLERSPADRLPPGAPPEAAMTAARRALAALRRSRRVRKAAQVEAPVASRERGMDHRTPSVDGPTRDFEPG